ncbi:MAG: hypothetical protein GF317_11275 [Candidatus Lokiarchaeota archaeon]|nr:hypothetical protein [Candidatus Lokiarchaeota archaeon]MBD3200230.1 hypothetical protein [Candidatus Lokiarchaeota archaeon]
MKSLELLSEYSNYLEEQKLEGKKIIAFMSHDSIPEELIDAAGFIPLRLIFAGNDDLMNASHDYLPPSTCSFAQSCIGYFARKPNLYKFLELVDYILLSNHCVSDICVSEIISDNFNVERLNLYVPYTRNESAIKYYKIELENLRKELENIIGHEIPDQKIKESIDKYNLFKKKLAEIEKLEISGSQKLEIFQKAILFGPKILNEIEKLIQKNREITSNDSQTESNNKKVIFTGCSIFLGDYLMDLIEESGGEIVFFNTWIGHNYISQIYSDKILNSTDDPIDLFLYRFKTNIYGDHSVPDSLDNEISYLETFINEYQKENGEKLAVINHVIKFCDHFSLFQSTLKERLQNKGIQVLNLERDYSRANRGQLSTRIEAFMEMI